MVKTSTLLLVPLSLFLAAATSAQNTISTVAGGGLANNAVPTSAGIEQPRGVAQDALGNTYFTSASVIYRVSAGTLTVYAGTGTDNYTGDGGPATSATVSTPYQLALDALGNVFFADAGNSVIRRIDATTGIVTTVAGNGSFGFSGDNGPATSASLNGPIGIAFDGVGNLYISDSANNVIRKVDTSPQHIITTIAGTGTCHFSGDGGPAVLAEICYPEAIAVDAHNNLFIADTGNSVVRRVDGTTAAISTVAGTTVAGYSGDNGVATQAQLRFPEWVTIDSSGSLFISDTGNNVVRRVDANTQVITTVAGNGSYGFAGDNGAASSASLASPLGISLGAGGVLLIADYYNRRIRAVSSANVPVITTFVGNGSLGDGGPATNATLAYPRNPALDSAGNLYFADTSNNLIRRVDAATHIISTVAGNGLAGFSGDGGPATSASINSPRAVSVDGQGNVYFSDINNQRIRRVDAATHLISTVAGNGVYGFSGDYGPATSASLAGPRGPAVDSGGNLYIPDTDNNRIRRVDAVTGMITTVAGSGPTGTSGSFSGDGSYATSATINSPLGVDIDSAGNLYIADTGNDRVRRVDAVTRIITTVAGNGNGGYTGDGGLATDATLGGPNRVTANGAGNLFISEGGNNVIRRVDGQTKLISTFAGNGVYGFAGDGGTATSASIASPLGVAVTNLGNLYIGDAGNHRIRLVTLSASASFLPASLSFGSQGVGVPSLPQIAKFANTGDAPISITSFGFSGDFAIDHSSCPTLLNVGSSCTLIVTFLPTTTGPRAGVFTFFDNGVNSPQTLTLSGTGVTGANVVLPPGGLVFAGQLIGGGSAPQSVNVLNSGNSPLSISNITINGPNASEFTQTNNCPPSLSIGATCAVQVKFTPLSPGPRTAVLVITDNQGGITGSQQSISLAGTGIAPATTPIISVAFNVPVFYTASPLVSGPEAAASAANVAFASANVWNNLNVPFGTLVTNASWSGLVNSKGATTTIGFSVSGSVLGVNLYDPLVNTDALRAQFIAFNSSTLAGESTAVNWQITGLVPNASYAICFYGSRADYARSLSMTVGNVTQTIPTLLFSDPSPSTCAYFPNATADGTGTIAGTATGIGSSAGVTNEANWSGFQIVQTPTTGTATASVPLSFTPGTNVSQVATINCPSGTVPCTDPNAHSFKLTVGQVIAPFTLTVTAYEVPLNEANGICESGQTETSDFDCRFVSVFGGQVLPNGDTVVPQCIPYSNGNCVFYRISNVPPDSSYQGPITQYIAWNNSAYLPPPNYQANNPRLYYDPDYAPYDINHQFVFDITDYYVSAGMQVGKDPGIGGNTKHFSDFAVAFPPNASTPYTFAWVAPLRAGRVSYFEQGNVIPVRFHVTPNTPAGVLTQAPNRTGYAVLLDTKGTGCSDFTGVRQPTATPPNASTDFTYDTVRQLYRLNLSGTFKPGRYKLLVTSNLMAEQCSAFVVTRD